MRWTVAGWKRNFAIERSRQWCTYNTLLSPCDSSVYPQERGESAEYLATKLKQLEEGFAKRYVPLTILENLMPHSASRESHFEFQSAKKSAAIVQLKESNKQARQMLQECAERACTLLDQIEQAKDDMQS